MEFAIIALPQFSSCCFLFVRYTAGHFQGVVHGPTLDLVVPPRDINAGVCTPDLVHGLDGEENPTLVPILDLEVGHFHQRNAKVVIDHAVFLHSLIGNVTKGTE